MGRIGLAGEMEQSMLGFAEGAAPNSRLACQIKMSDGLDGLVVRLPEAQH
jgi:2Fe-2S ferredoxin